MNCVFVFKAKYCLLLCFIINFADLDLKVQVFAKSNEEFDIDIDVMSYFFDGKNNTFSPDSEIQFYNEYIHFSHHL